MIIFRWPLMILGKLIYVIQLPIYWLLDTLFTIKRTVNIYFLTVGMWLAYYSPWFVEAWEGSQEPFIFYGKEIPRGDGIVLFELVLMFYIMSIIMIYHANRYYQFLR